MRPLPGVFAQSAGGSRGPQDCQSNREPWQALSSLHRRCSPQASLAPVLPGVFLPSFSYFQNGALRFWDLPKEALPRLENSQCACNPCSAWISHLAYLFPFKQFSVSSILEYLEIPEYQVLRPQIFSVSIMLRALSVNVSSSEVDGDFKD